MNKKVKIVGSLSLIAATLALGAQIYTNHKIDYILQKFPYSLQNKFQLDVVEKKKNFFSRELIFKLSGDSTNTSSEMIQTKLTALPFAVFADSALVPSFVKELNKNFKVTIDKNNITSKFSVIGDYFQSNIYTQFRDLANKSQTLVIDLNFEPKSHLMDVQSHLSGFNYDANSKIHDLIADATLIPIDDNQYDIENISIKLKDGDVYLLNGDNTNIKLKKLDFNLDKSDAGSNYNLSAKINADGLTITDKNPKHSTIQFKNVALNASQKEIPNQLSYVKLLHLLNNKNELNTVEIIDQALDLLFQNKESELSFTFENLTFTHKEKDQGVSFDNFSSFLKGNFSDLSQAQSNYALALKSCQNKGENEHFQIKGIQFEGNNKNVNLATQLALLKSTIQLFSKAKSPETKQEAKQVEKEKSTFISALKTLAQDYNQSQQALFKIDEFTLDDNIELKEITIGASGAISEEKQDNENIELTLGSYINKKEQFQLKNGKFSLPFSVTNVGTLIPLNICSNLIYQAACDKYLNADEDTDLLVYQPIKNIAINIENATLSGEIDTYPSTSLTPFEGKLNLKSGILEEQQDKTTSTLLLEKWQKTEFDLYFSIVNKLFKANLLKDKQSISWSLINDWLYPEGELNPYLKENGDNYTIQIKKEGDKTWLNDEILPPILVP
ncbi:hypothetical protein L5B97_11645 [Avibacterium sp. 20-15]|uniref:hypothetical protein n=1 Tax=unclassified Avibacterium TaxID=2685287 RepID=UPI002026F09F|nr:MULTISPECIES: hypothetical protein [unclassified Avibacterium]MCW9734110.1 hypothetical protein [Avibacterium sp. 20-15]URL03755.1 hypothetical protein L4F93_09300 [Avibacterium sp. 20-132]